MKEKIAVVGLGTMGSMILWQLAKQGANVVGFEQYGLAHERSAAGGESRMFRTAYLEGDVYVPLLKKSRQLWEQLEQETNADLLQIHGGLMIGPEDSDRIGNVIKSIENYDIDGGVISHAEAKKLYPQHRLSENEIMVLDREAGFLRPEYAVFTATKRAQALGATAHHHVRVHSIEEKNDKVYICSDKGKEEFDKVIVTAGPWTNHFFPGLTDNLLPLKIVMTWYTTENLKNYQADTFPVFARLSEEIDIFGTPTLDGAMIKVGSVDTFGPVEDPYKLHRDVQLSDLTTLNNAVSKFLPELNPDPVRISVHMDGYTTDDHPVIGYVPGLSRTIVMGGYSGHGFKLAPIMGKIGADLALHGESKDNLSEFDPNRFLTK